MKKIAKTTTSLFVCLLVIFSCLTAFAAPPRFVDNANLLSEADGKWLTEYLDEYSEELQLDIVILTVNTLDGKTVEAYADDYYDYNGYGYGTEHDGCILLIDMGSRQWHIGTTGYGIVMTDANLESIEKAIVPYLSSGDYKTAFGLFAEKVHTYITNARKNNLTPNPVPRDPSNNGEGLPYGDYAITPQTKNIVQYVAFGFIGGNVVALITIAILAGQLKSVRAKKEATDYMVAGSSHVTSGKDIYLYKNVTKTRHASESSSGGSSGGSNSSSSTHTSSSGTTHGGRSGSF